MRQLRDPHGLSQIKDILDDFGASIDILSQKKEIQYNAMSKACGILADAAPSNSPSKQASGDLKKRHKSRDASADQPQEEA